MAATATHAAGQRGDALGPEKPQFRYPTHAGKEKATLSASKCPAEMRYSFRPNCLQTRSLRKSPHAIAATAFVCVESAEVRTRGRIGRG
jgi:hypothetical protein